MNWNLCYSCAEQFEIHTVVISHSINICLLYFEGITRYFLHLLLLMSHLLEVFIFLPAFYFERYEFRDCRGGINVSGVGFILNLIRTLHLLVNLTKGKTNVPCVP